MYFSKILEDDVEYSVIECTKLDNNILLYKQKIDENACNVIKLKNNQYAILFKKGLILDVIQDEGIYIIKNGSNKQNVEDFIDYSIKENNDDLCVIFFNTGIIENNKFYINKNHNKEFYGEGNFEFIVQNPIKLFNKVIQIRSYYSREELLEQIRERISKIMISVIKDNEDEYILDETYIESNINIFNEYGIKIISCDMKNIYFKKNK